MIVFRPAEARDQELIEKLFVLTADWRPGEARGHAHWVAQPEFATYTADFGRPGDGGVIAENSGELVGGVWWRLFPASDPGYGFVDELTPEVGIAVVDGWRGRGVGRGLLRAALDRHPRLSLSVEDGNPARALYQAEGFVAVGRSGDSTVMLHSGAPVHPEG